MKKASLCLYLTFVILTQWVQAQDHPDLVSGPMLGQVDYRTAAVWVEAKLGKQPLLRFWKQSNKKESWLVKGSSQPEAQRQGFNVMIYHISGLDVNTVYEYQLDKGSSDEKADGSFTTKELWQWRKPPPDFSFIAGSCSYMNEPGYDRTWRSSDRLLDSIGGQPNPLKKMFGDQQMGWLKNALAGSMATFKVIVTGSQVLNPQSPFDCFRRFPVEYHPFMQFLADQKINGVVFLTGDRHHSEIIRLEGLTPYPLYDVTVSPLTSGTHVFGPAEKINPYRVIGIDQLQNYARISISGPAKDRELKVSFLDLQGKQIGEWKVNEKELR
jgi:hypothetical protein